MSDLSVGGPLAVDLIGIDATWKAQSHSNNDTADRAVGLKANGDGAASEVHNERNEITVEYECHETSGNLVLPSVGDFTSGGYLIDSWNLSESQTGWPRLSVTAHNHDANAHSADTNLFACPLTIAAGFGVSSTFASPTANTARVSATVAMSATHIDEMDGDGNHAAGATVNGQCTVELQFLGTAAAVPTAISAASFDQLGTPTGGSNSAQNTSSMSFAKSVVRT